MLDKIASILMVLKSFDITSMVVLAVSLGFLAIIMSLLLKGG